MPINLLVRAVATSRFAITLADARAADLPLTYVNQAFETLTGYRAEEVQGRNCRFLQGPETDPRAIAKVHDTLKREAAGTALLLNYRKDGTRFWNRFQLSPVHEDDGTLVAYLGMQVDLTEDVERIGHEAERRKMETLGRLAGGVAHELNNALQPIRLNADLLTADLDLDEATKGRCANAILQHTEFASDIVGQVLSFARRDNHADHTYEARDVILAAVKFAAEYVPSSMSFSYRGFGTEEEVAAAKVTLNRTALVQVMANLFKNAADASGDKGTIEVTLGREGSSHLVVTVADNGCGMPPETLEQIFDPFFTTKAPDRGVGLGLSTIYGIVERWGGRITANSVPGKGTSFRMTIPLTHGT